MSLSPYPSLHDYDHRRSVRGKIVERWNSGCGPIEKLTQVHALIGTQVTMV